MNLKVKKRFVKAKPEPEAAPEDMEYTLIVSQSLLDKYPEYFDYLRNK